MPDVTLDRRQGARIPNPGHGGAPPLHPPLVGKEPSRLWGPTVEAGDRQ